MRLKVNEIFYSLQGEGQWTGTPAVFVRLSGCNLNCDFCDTKYHRYFFEMEVLDIVGAVTQYPTYPTDLVVITGGEPLVQAEALEALVTGLQGWRFQVHLETNGSLPLPEGLKPNWVTVSPKVRPLQITSGDEMKVLFEGGEKVEQWRAEYPNFQHYFLQPVSGRDIPAIVEYIKAHAHWRLSLQWQRILSIR